MERTTRASCGRCGWQGTLTSPALAARSMQRHRCEPHLNRRPVVASCPRGCGYRRRYPSRALADYGMRLHSCANHLERLARAERVAQRKASRGGIVRECLHKIARHKHGTRQAYVLDKCRCLPCLDAAGAYERARVRAKLYGRQARRVDAEPVRAHLRELKAAGVSCKSAAKLAGVPLTTVSTLIYGRHDRRGGQPTYTIRADYAAKILAVQPDPFAMPDRCAVDATGTQRRIQALMAIGWSQSKLADRLGMQITNFGRILDHRHVHARTARAVAALYDQLWNAAPPEQGHHDKIAANRSRRYAAERGWLPPLAWDDETIDDPATRPDPTVAALARPTLCPECGKRCVRPSALISHRAAVHGVEHVRIETPPAVEALDEIVIERYIAGELRATPNSRVTPELREAVERLAGSGFTAAEIGRRVGLSKTAVSQLCSRRGISTGGGAAA